MVYSVDVGLDVCSLCLAKIIFLPSLRSDLFHSEDFWDVLVAIV